MNPAGLTHSKSSFTSAGRSACLRGPSGLDNNGPLKEVAGNVILTKSGGIHGIRNPAGNTQRLKFVAFGYSAS
jgi:hypothetical protein